MLNLIKAGVHGESNVFFPANSDTSLIMLTAASTLCNFVLRICCELSTSQMIREPFAGQRGVQCLLVIYLQN